MHRLVNVIDIFYGRDEVIFILREKTLKKTFFNGKVYF